MQLILLIDTAVTTASVALAGAERIIAEKTNASQKDHASWLHVAIKQLLREHDFQLSDLDAVAISYGPGSYTGLRVGLSAAKGICFALGKPLVTINTLRMMAEAARQETTDLLCPMIDARRMEVFTAVFDRQMNMVLPPSNLILDKDAYNELLETGSICFFGNGSSKFQPLVSHPNAKFASIEASAGHMLNPALEKIKLEEFASLAYAEPFYGKEFYLPSVKPPI